MTGVLELTGTIERQSQQTVNGEFSKHCYHCPSSGPGTAWLRNLPGIL